MSTDVDRPEWLVPGAEVVVFAVGNRATKDAKTATIHRVATKSFTVTGSAYRFKTATQEYHERSGAFGFGWTIRVVPVDSPIGQRKLADARRVELEYAARDACEAWIHERTTENRLAAIAALQAIDTEE